MLKTGDHVIAGDDLYGGTNRLLRNVAIPMGIEVDFIDCTNLELIEKSIKPNTRVSIYVTFTFYSTFNMFKTK